RLGDIGRPLAVVLDRIDRQADDLDAALVEFALQLGDRAELGRADRGEILGVREQDDPIAACPVMKADFALGGVLLEIRGDVTDTDAHRGLPCGRLMEAIVYPAWICARAPNHARKKFV